MAKKWEKKQGWHLQESTELAALHERRLAKSASVVPLEPQSSLEPAEKRFVGQGRRLERVIGALAAELLAG